MLAPLSIFFNISRDSKLIKISNNFWSESTFECSSNILILFDFALESKFGQSKFVMQDVGSRQEGRPKLLILNTHTHSRRSRSKSSQPSRSSEPSSFSFTNFLSKGIAKRDIHFEPIPCFVLFVLIQMFQQIFSLPTQSSVTRLGDLNPFRRLSEVFGHYFCQRSTKVWHVGNLASCYTR